MGVDGMFGGCMMGGAGLIWLGIAALIKYLKS